MQNGYITGKATIKIYNLEDRCPVCKELIFTEDFFKKCPECKKVFHEKCLTFFSEKLKTKFEKVDHNFYFNCPACKSKVISYKLINRYNKKFDRYIQVLIFTSIILIVYLIYDTFFIF